MNSDKDNHKDLAEHLMRVELFINKQSREKEKTSKIKQQNGVSKDEKDSGTQKD